jgi:ribulose-phosphate 3-epimerase
MTYNETHPWCVYASILSADPLALGGEIQSVDPYVDGLHWDVMDGHYVPNLTLGPALIRRARTTFPAVWFDVHIMAQPAQEILGLFWDLEIQSLSFHPATVESVETCLSALHQRRIRRGFAINLEDDPFSWPSSWWNQVDYAVVMAVKPGFPAQTFNDASLDHIRQLRARFPSLSIVVDGGITNQTAPQCYAAGANGVISGNFIFQGTDYQKNVAQLRHPLF